MLTGNEIFIFPYLYRSVGIWPYLSSRCVQPTFVRFIAIKNVNWKGIVRSDMKAGYELR